MSVKASDRIAKFLKRHGIRHVFGIVGAGNAHIFDSIARLGFTEIICVHHEQAATMAMQSYYRISGKVTAAILTTGGGSSNGVTGVVGAWMDSMPGLIISGNENSKYTTPENPLRVWGVQGYDSVEMVRKVTKYAHRVMDPRQVDAELEKAYAIARSGRPGPCWIDIPMNIQSMAVEEKDYEQWKVSSSPSQNTDLEEQVRQTLDLLSQAKRPLLWLGIGIRHANAVSRVKTLLENLRVPTLVSWAGIDIVDSGHPLVFGRAGVYGQRSANFILQNCDFLLTIGTRLAIPQVGYDLSEFARAAKIVMVDVEESETRKLGNRVDLPICASADVFLDSLLDQASKRSPPVFDEWIKTCNRYRTKYPWVGSEHRDENGFLNSYPFMDKLSNHLKPDQIVVTDMGTALLSGHQALKIKEGQRLITSTGLGEMGFGLPGAIGASFAKNKSEVLCLNCDGGMMMNLQELQTIAHHKLPIKIIIFNNDGYLMIKHTQKALFKGHYAGTDQKSGISCPDFTKLAKAFDMTAFQIRTWPDFERVIPGIQKEKGPLICEVFMHPEQPFVPKLSLAPQADGTLVSPPLEDLSPLLPRQELKDNMLIGLHPKSAQIKVE
ncbi:MAG: thiamine pyrophosphate-binding protein [Candidatus Omnitrophica bacterium]|nr:thiamine pyrophosphate-binding protein [Candidatus Omnitrophota bacterium]